MLETTHSLTKETIHGLQELIQINLDSSEGLEAAADRIENDRVARLFRTMAPERRQFASELQDFVRLNRVDPKDHGSVKGTLHRWWLNIHGTIRTGDEHAVLADAEAGEDAIKHRYEEVLKSTAGSPLQRILTEQYKRVKAGHDTIRDLRDASAS